MKADQIIQTIYKIGSEIRSTPFNLRKFEDSAKSTPKSSRMRWNLITVDEFGFIKLFKLKYRREDQIIQTFQTFCKIGSPPPEISAPLFNFKKFQDSEENTPESYRIHWNLMNDNDFGFAKLLRFKYKRGDQIIQTFCKIVSSQKLGHPSLICRNSKSLRKLQLNHAECLEI